MKINIKKLPLLLSSVIIISCNTGQEKNVKVDDKKELEAKADECIYSFSDSTIKLFWAGYKTTDKLKVLGSFQEISTNHSNQKYTSLEQLVEGITFSINSASSESGDPIRDANLKDYFFNYLTTNFEINGSLTGYNEDVVMADIDVLGVNRTVKLKHFLVNNILKLRGELSLSELGAFKAFSSIAEKCYDLHKGPDGISKTWDEVNVLIDVPLIQENCK